MNKLFLFFFFLCSVGCEQKITGWDVLNVTECAVFHPGAKIIGWLPNFVNCND